MLDQAQREMSTHYTQEFYKDLEEVSQRSAREIVPIIIKLVNCPSVVDVGCGTGEWLSVFRECGVENVLGIDGTYVDASLLKIPPDQFFAADLRQPLDLEQSFDLAVSLEVAEHLPAECADVFVGSLVRLSKVVLFSAAVPFQDGTGHINEQWPEYWIDRFRRFGYTSVDCLRPLLWHNSNVAWWYRQNIMLFIQETALAGHPHIQSQLQNGNLYSLPLVHPELYSYHTSKNMTLSADLAALSATIERPSVRRFILLRDRLAKIKHSIFGRGFHGR